MAYLVVLVALHFHQDLLGHHFAHHHFVDLYLGLIGQFVDFDFGYPFQVDYLDYSGLLDFVVLVEQPDIRKYEYIEFPQADTWGLIIPENDPLAKKKSIGLDDLIGLPLFCSDQAWNGDIKKWAGSRFSELQLEGTFRLSYNGSIFTMEGLGYLLTYDHLIDTSKNNGLAFRPLSPKLENKIYFAWNRYQTFTPIAERFLSHLKVLVL